MTITIKSSLRDDLGTGPSRRLRHRGKVPGVVYGGAGKEAVAISLDHDELFHASQRPDFHGQIINLEIGDTKEEVLLQALQRHPFKQKLIHVDFLRTSRERPVVARIKLRFSNAENSPAVKLTSSVITYVNRSVLVRGLVKDLPEYFDVDLSGLHGGESIHLSDIKVPDNLQIVLLASGQNQPLVQATKGRLSS